MYSIDFIILSYTFLVFSCAQYKEYLIWSYWFSKYSDVLLVFTHTSAIYYLRNICLGVNLFICSPVITLYVVSNGTVVSLSNIWIASSLT